MILPGNFVNWPICSSFVAGFSIRNCIWCLLLATCRYKILGVVFVFSIQAWGSLSRLASHATSGNKSGSGNSYNSLEKKKGKLIITGHWSFEESQKRFSHVRLMCKSEMLQWQPAWISLLYSSSTRCPKDGTLPIATLVGDGSTKTWPGWPTQSPFSSSPLPIHVFFNGQCVTEMKSGTCRHSATVGHSGPRVSKCSEHASLPPCRNALCWACGSIVASWKYVGTQIECLRNDRARYRQHSTTKCGDRLEGSKLNRTSPVLSRWTHVTGPGICGR